MGNYNLKNILLGIGIGLVFSSMINISMSSKDLTVEEIKKEAVKHNLIVLSEDEVLNNSLNTVPAAEPAATGNTAVTAPSTGSKEMDSEEKITVNIKSGMSSEVIADILKESNLIKDKQEFLKKLKELGKDEGLMIGSFDIAKGSSYEEIIDILTK